MTTMQIYEVRISLSALADIDNLRIFLDSMMTEEGAIRYANAVECTSFT